MPKSIHLDHHDTAHYIPMCHRTEGFTGHEREVYKSLVSRLIHEGVCVYTPEWPILSLQNDVDSYPDIYPPPHEDSSLIHDALFYERTQPKTQKMKGVDTFLDPYQMIISELKFDIKKWEIILSENADKGKGPRIPILTPSNSEPSNSPSPTPHQGNDHINNYTLDPIPYMNQLPSIEGGESSEFKKTKGLLKCLFCFLSKKK
uniref:Uncharacterized protein n=1 Tax=Tanacetum cinerariifolium TaxID=118510 RepID=A0A6L2MI16_TANCI|nr:hypothetical protein [Tanacetum cinerariifolium]